LNRIIFPISDQPTRIITNEKIKYFLRKTNQKRTKNRFRSTKTGNNNPIKAIGQKLEGGIYIAEYESSKKTMAIKLMISIIHEEDEILDFLFTGTAPFFFAFAVTIYY
jgi:hypothetical protein